MKSMGPVIRSLRVLRGIGVNEFAEKIDVDSGNYSRFENGGGRLKMPETLYPMAEVLKTTVPAIFILYEKAKKDKGLLRDSAVLSQVLEHVNSVLEKI